MVNIGEMYERSKSIDEKSDEMVRRRRERDAAIFKETEAHPPPADGALQTQLHVGTNGKVNGVTGAAKDGQLASRTPGQVVAKSG